MISLFNRSRKFRKARLHLSPICVVTLVFLALSAAAESAARFERTYNPRGSAHLTLSNLSGRIRVSAWEKRSISVRATAAPSVEITDSVSGDDILVAVRRSFRAGHADFEVLLPAETSLTLKNLMGDIEVRGVSGHLTVDSFDSTVRLIDVNSPSVDVKVTNGDVLFDGNLKDGGTYSLQTVRGDLDVTVPESTPFNLNARALSENINLGSFISNLVGASRGPKGVSGSYLKGGPRLSLTAYAGRILLHKK